MYAGKPEVGSKPSRKPLRPGSVGLWLGQHDYSRRLQISGPGTRVETRECTAGKPSETIPPNSSNSSDTRPRLLVSKRLPSTLARGKVSSFRDAVQGSEIYRSSDDLYDKRTDPR
jgi:hypothetical protein